jgi:hypothetical protein
VLDGAGGGDGVEASGATPNATTAAKSAMRIFVG